MGKKSLGSITSAKQGKPLLFSLLCKGKRFNGCRLSLSPLSDEYIICFSWCLGAPLILWQVSLQKTTLPNCSLTLLRSLGLYYCLSVLVCNSTWYNTEVMLRDVHQPVKNATKVLADGALPCSTRAAASDNLPIAPNECSNDFVQSSCSHHAKTWARTMVSSASLNENSSFCWWPEENSRWPASLCFVDPMVSMYLHYKYCSQCNAWIHFFLMAWHVEMLRLKWFKILPACEKAFYMGVFLSHVRRA